MAGKGPCANYKGPPAWDAAEIAARVEPSPNAAGQAASHPLFQARRPHATCRRLRRVENTMPSLYKAPCEGEDDGGILPFARAFFCSGIRPKGATPQSALCRNGKRPSGGCVKQSRASYRNERHVRMRQPARRWLVPRTNASRQGQWFASVRQAMQRARGLHHGVRPQRSLL